MYIHICIYVYEWCSEELLESVAGPNAISSGLQAAKLASWQRDFG